MTTSGASLERAALAPFSELRSLWFQVTGLHCNLACSHCLVDSSPANRSMAYLEVAEIEAALAEATAFGVKEVYFTGGEPFLHPDLLVMLERTLAVAPATVLTNGTLIDDAVADRLAELAAASRYSLEVRISLDDVDPARNDLIRGGGVLERVAGAARRLYRRGLLPILTATELIADPAAWAATGAGPLALPPATSLYERFRAFLAELGVQQPRVKIMPVFRAGRLRPLAVDATGVTEAMAVGFDWQLLQCHTARVVAADGIYACPILVGEHHARVADHLHSALNSVALADSACRTCYETGMTCGNA